MASELWVNDAGTARQIREVWVNDAGVARRIQEIWVNDSGTARCIFRGDLITIENVNILAENTISTVTAVYSLRSTGDIYYNQSGTNTVIDQGDWITPKSNMAAYECRADITGGTLTTGTTGAWQSLASDRSWTVSRPQIAGTGQNSCTFTLQIRRASDATVLDSASIFIEAAIP